MSAEGIRRLNRTRDAEPGETLCRLASALALSHDELALMLEVDGESVQRWMHGQAPVPGTKRAAIREAGVALEQLLRMFLPERLPEVIRRPARAFGGERALDWILRGRIQEVAAGYDRALMYQA